MTQKYNCCKQWLYCDNLISAEECESIFHTVPRLKLSKKKEQKKKVTDIIW